MKIKVTSRDDLLVEFQSRFKEGQFEKSEHYNKKVIDGIWVSKKCHAGDGLLLINLDNWDVHPDFEVFLEKYDAWIEPTEDEMGFFVFIKIKQETTCKKAKADLKKSLSFRLPLQHIKSIL
jgi:hypothetical protein